MVDAILHLLLQVLEWGHGPDGDVLCQGDGLVPAFTIPALKAPCQHLTQRCAPTPVLYTQRNQGSFLTIDHLCIAHAGLTLWNNLPQVNKNAMSPDSFKRNLKTHLFNASLFLLAVLRSVIMWHKRTIPLNVFVLSIVLISICFHTRLEHSTK